MLTREFERNLSRTEESFKRLEEFRDYLAKFRKWITWEKYFEMRRRTRGVGSIKRFLNEGPVDEEKISDFVLRIEREKIRKIFKAESFRFQE